MNATANKKTVAVLAAHANLAAAITEILTPRLPNTDFVSITKMSEIPEGNVTLASIGLPNYLPTDRVSNVITLNTNYVEGVDARSAQWKTLRDENAPVEDIIEILGATASYKVIPNKRAIAVRADYAEARAEFAEAGEAKEGEETPTNEEKLQRQLEAMTKMRDLALSVSALK